MASSLLQSAYNCTCKNMSMKRACQKDQVKISIPACTSEGDRVVPVKYEIVTIIQNTAHVKASKVTEGEFMTHPLLSILKTSSMHHVSCHTKFIVFKCLFTLVQLLIILIYLCKCWEVIWYNHLLLMCLTISKHRESRVLKDCPVVKVKTDNFSQNELYRTKYYETF